MVKVEQADLDAKLREFSQSIASKALLFDKIVTSCLRIECRRLCESLIRISPPTNVKNSRAKISRDVGKKFETLGQGDERGMAGLYSATKDKAGNDLTAKRGHGDTRWLLWNSHLLLGVAEDMDMRNASMEHLKDIHRTGKFTPKGREHRGKRGKQSVIVIRKRLTDPATVQKLIKHLWGNIGRLKAGWLVAWKAVGGESDGKYKPPQYVLNHGGPGVRGGVDVAMINDPSMPAVRIWNTAKGVGTAYMRTIANDALGIRLKSLVKRTVALIKLQAKDESKFQEVLAQDFE